MDTLRLTSGEAGRSYRIRVGDEVVVELAENPTTGYVWTIESGSVGLFRSDPPSYRVADTAGPGAAGVRVFRLIAVAPGSTTIRLKHWRAWQGDKSVIGRFHVTLEIQ